MQRAHHHIDDGRFDGIPAITPDEHARREQERIRQLTALHGGPVVDGQKRGPKGPSGKRWKKTNRGPTRRVLVDGQLFDSITDAAKFLNTTQPLLSLAISRMGGRYRGHMIQVLGYAPTAEQRAKAAAAEQTGQRRSAAADC